MQLCRAENDMNAGPGEDRPDSVKRLSWMPMFLCARNRAFSRQNIVCSTVSFKEVLNDKSIIHGMLFTSKLPKAIFRKMYSRYDAYYRCKYMQLEKCRDLNFSVLLDSYNEGLSMKQALGLRPRASLSFLSMCIPDENANICGGSYALKIARLMHRILYTICWV